MRVAHFHAVCGNIPGGLLKIEFLPCCATHLAGTHASQDEKLQRRLDCRPAIIIINSVEQNAKAPFVGDCGPPDGLWRLQGAMQGNCWVFGGTLGYDGVLEHAADGATQPAGCLAAAAFSIRCKRSRISAAVRSLIGLLSKGEAKSFNNQVGLASVLLGVS